jgi:hypothetical protein
MNELADVAHERLTYDPATGVFAWRSGSRAPRGFAGTPTRQGYIQIQLMGKLYLAHRLAWLMTHGEWPPEDIDHINGDKADNRIANLRQASRSQNLANTRLRRDNRVGVKGVERTSRNVPRPFRAKVGIGGKYVIAPYRATLAEAAADYAQKAAEVYGEFARPAALRVE